MSWLLSISIIGLFFTNTNLPLETAPQIVVSTPQAAWQGDETEKIEQTYPLNANGRISVDNVNGSIIIEAWDKNEVKLEAVKIADSRERLAEVDVKIDSKSDYLRVSTHYGRNGNWNCSGNCRLEVQYKLTVPRNAVLNEIETVNGSVTISNTTNYTKASAVNGTVKATNLRGTAYIETVNGTSEISFERLEGDNKINLSTVNGRINLIIPSDADATIKAETVSGSINNEFNLPVRKGKYVGRDLYGKLGDGNVKINLEAVNGTLNVKRQADGKNTKPATNLLNMNEDAEDDVDIDVSNNSKMNKEIARSVRESMKVAAKAPEIAAKAIKQSAKAMEQSQREMEQSQRDMEQSQRDMEQAQRDAQREIVQAQRNIAQAFGGNWGDFAARSIVEKSDSFSIKGTPKVTVDAKKCAVFVRGWDKDEVKYRVLRTIRGKEVKDLNLDVSNSPSEVNIKVDISNSNPKGEKSQKINADDEEVTINGVRVYSNENVRIEVFVPKKSNLRILTDREIRVEGISGSIDLSGNDEAINVRDSNGKLKLTAADALVRVIGFTGEVDSKMECGTSFFEGDFAKFSAKTDTGKIVLTLPENTDADIKSETEIQAEGFDLNENNGSYRLGNGGKVFNLKADKGELIVRNARILNAKF